MSEGMEELRRENQELRRENARFRREVEKVLERLAKLEKENDQLRGRIAHLEKRLRESETAEAHEEARLKKPDRQRRRRPPGPPEDHPGVTRPPPDHVDETRTHTLDRCPHCQGPVEKVGEETRPEWEYVPARTWVIEHHILHYRCQSGCGTFPAAEPTPAGSPFGPRLHALVALLRSLGIPYGKLRLLLRLQLGLQATKAALMAMLHRVAEALEPRYQRLQEDLRKSSAVEGDETGWRQDGRRAYLWALTSAGPPASGPPTVLYTIERGRGHQVPMQILGPGWKGVFLRDGYPAFDSLPYEMQVCLVHLKRKLLDVEARRSGVTREFWRCARWLRRILNMAIRGSQEIPFRWRRRRAQLRARMERLVDQLTAHPWMDPDAKRICKTLRRHRDYLFTFLTRRVPYHTNGVEREIRPCVVTRKNSYGSRSKRGARDLAVVMSVAVTCQRRGEDFLDLVQKTLSNQRAWTP